MYRKAYNENTKRITLVSLKKDELCECGEPAEFGEPDVGIRKIIPICRKCMLEKLGCNT